MKPKKSKTQTLLDLSRLYLAHGPNSAPACLQALSLVLRRTVGHDDWQALPLNVINGATARAWFAHADKLARQAPDQARQQQIHRTARSTFAQARAVICPRSLEHLERAGLVLPDAPDFYHAAKKNAPRIASNGAGELPDAATIARALEQWRQWPATPERANDFVAVGLILSCGLRKAEVSQACWCWITERQGAPVLSGRAQVKNQSGQLEVMPLNPFWQQWLDGLALLYPVPPAAAAPLLVGSYTETTDAVFRRIGAWLRGLGWNTEKTNHSLRDYSASLITMKYGLHFAKMWCRHASIETTERSYNRFVDPLVMIQRARSLDWLSFAGEK